MEFRTIVDVKASEVKIEPHDEILLVGSCFADGIGRHFQEEKFPTTVNPYGTMYNPASVLHTVERCEAAPRFAFLTLGTNHVYIEKATGEIVDNCQKRPANLFEERELTVEECVDCLRRIVEILRSRRSDVQVVVTVSPIRYRKYGYHESQLSKATLLLSVERLLLSDSTSTAEETSLNAPPSTLTYFPAYEMMMDELRDYRFYADDMLHPSSQAVEYIWQQLVAHYFSPRAKEFLREWAPLKAALNHRPFNPESDEYRQFLADTHAKIDDLLSRYPAPTASLPTG